MLRNDTRARVPKPKAVGRRSLRDPKETPSGGITHEIVHREDSSKTGSRKTAVPDASVRSGECHGRDVGGARIQTLALRRLVTRLGQCSGMTPEPTALGAGDFSMSTFPQQ